MVASGCREANGRSSLECLPIPARNRPHRGSEHRRGSQSRIRLWGGFRGNVPHDVEGQRTASAGSVLPDVWQAICEGLTILKPQLNLDQSERDIARGAKFIAAACIWVLIGIIGVLVWWSLR